MALRLRPPSCVGGTCTPAMRCLQVVEEDILASKHANGSTSRTPFETRREVTEREWFVVRARP
jgi:hypothetical protein